MVKWPHLYSSVSSQKTPKFFTLKSVIRPLIYMLVVVNYIVSTAALGQTDRSKAAIQSDHHQQVGEEFCQGLNY